MLNRRVFIGIMIIIGCAMLTGTALGNGRSLTFDGRDFKETKKGGYPVLRHQEGYLPFVDYSGSRPQESRLPEGTGAVAGLCFVQVAGGKAHKAPGYLPMPGETVEIRDGKTIMAVRSDASGYFVLALPPGNYDLRVRNIGRKVTVERGKTTFVALRGAKRMVD